MAEVRPSVRSSPVNSSYSVLTISSRLAGKIGGQPTGGLGDLWVWSRPLLGRSNLDKLIASPDR